MEPDATGDDEVGSDALDVTRLASDPQAAVPWVKRMFRARGYGAAHDRAKWDASLGCWCVTGRTGDGQRITAFLTALMFVSTDDDVGILSDVRHQRKLGNDIMRLILDWATAQHVRHIIVVADAVSPHAQKMAWQWAHAESSHHSLTFFTYAELSIPRMGHHVDQPLSCTRLSDEERLDYITRHPRYLTECPVFPDTDPLLKYLGFRAGDLIRTEETDSALGFCVEVALVVAPPGNEL